MEPALKQRLLGAAVLVALAVVFLPLLVMDPAPDSGASSVPLRVPAAPDGAGDTRTLDLPLAPASTGAPVLPTPASAPADASEPAPPAASAPNVAAGNYAVNFGSYATPADAARVIAALAAAHLPSYQEAASLGARTVHRVRIGPYATSAAAEAARLAAGRVRSDVNARVVVLDAAGATAPAVATAPLPSTAAVATAPLPATNPAPQVSTAPRSAAPPPASPAAVSTTTQREPTATEPPKPAAAPAPPAPAPAAASVGYAVQLGAFANPDEATHLRDRARAAGFSAFVEQVRTDRGTLSRVRVGPAPDRAAADALRAQVASKLGVSGIVRPHP